MFTKHLRLVIAAAIAVSLLALTPAPALASTTITAPTTVTVGEEFQVKTTWRVSNRAKGCFRPGYDFGGEPFIETIDFSWCFALSSGFEDFQAPGKGKKRKRFEKETEVKTFAYKDPGVYTITAKAGFAKEDSNNWVRAKKKAVKGKRTVTHTITVLPAEQPPVESTQE
jgi:hypothetical protein